MDLSKKVHLSVSFPASLIQHVQNNLVVLCADADAGRLVLIAVHQKRTDFILHLFANQTAQVARAALLAMRFMCQQTQRLVLPDQGDALGPPAAL